MRLAPKNRRHLVEAALGTRPVDLLIQNIRLVNVFTGEIYPADVALYDGFIAHVQRHADGEASPIEAREVFDGEGQYLIPGLIDSHVHIESSMMTPGHFAKTIVPHGTTTAITDPHEIGNVLGVEGVRYMLDASEDLPMRQYILAPSCVPSVPGLETAGASFGPEEVAEMLDWDRVLGLAEVMDFFGVIHGAERMVGILDEALQRDMFIQGHSPTLSGRALSAYLCAGPASDHEVRVGAEAQEKMRLGMIIDGRESSISTNLSELIPAMADFQCPPNFTLCTDDREPADLIHQGNMNYVVRRAIEEGMDPLMAIRHSTLETARWIGLDNLGAIAPGYVADLLLLPVLEELRPSHVFFEGQRVAQAGQLIAELPQREFAVEQMNTVRLQPLTEVDLTIALPANYTGDQIDVQVISYATQDSLFADFALETLPITGETLDISDRPDLNWVAVFHRHGANDNRCLGLIQQFGLNRGAIASTVSHDCHNLTVVSTNVRDAAIAANVLIECGGGLVCVDNGEIIDLVPLPIAGLMSPMEPEALAARTHALKETLRDMGIPGEDPLLRIATLTLAVIPKAKFTDMGMVAVEEQEFRPLFPGQ